MESVTFEKQGMLKILQDLYLLLKNGKQIKASDIRLKTGIELKHWVKLTNHKLIKNVGTLCNKPVYKWDTIFPNIYMAAEVLKETPQFGLIKEIETQTEITNDLTRAKVDIDNDYYKLIFRAGKFGGSFIYDELGNKVPAYYKTICKRGHIDMYVDFTNKIDEKYGKSEDILYPSMVMKDFDDYLKLKINKDKECPRKEIDKKPEKAIPPTIEQVKQYCDERKNNINPVQFMSYYESNGWRVGKDKMKDWKASVRYWETRKNNPIVYSHNDNLCKYTDEELTRELKRRGYSGGLQKDIKF